MATISIPDDAYYVLVTCVPNGDATNVNVAFSDALDHASALFLLEGGKADITQKKQTAENAAALKRLTASPAHLTALPVEDALAKNGKSVARVT
ncbi:MAG: hypothetical protein LC793_08390 [Thermomicrobia bacterium]|nr:hypothetical protein [Thermomicrobia bacterium]